MFFNRSLVTFLIVCQTLSVKAFATDGCSVDQHQSLTRIAQELEKEGQKFEYGNDGFTATVVTIEGQSFGLSSNVRRAGADLEIDLELSSPDFQRTLAKKTVKFFENENTQLVKSTLSGAVSSLLKAAGRVNQSIRDFRPGVTKTFFMTVSVLIGGGLCAYSIGALTPITIVPTLLTVLFMFSRADGSEFWRNM